MGLDRGGESNDTLRFYLPSIWPRQNSLKLLINLASHSKEINITTLILHLDYFPYYTWIFENRTHEETQPSSNQYSSYTGMSQ